MIKKILATGFLCMFIVSQLWAQTSQQPQVEMADALRENGKIYVVVLVVFILFTFLLAYLLLTDRQVKKLEREVNEFKKNKT